MKIKTIDDLKQIVKELRNIPNINRGGCGIASYVIYQLALQIVPDSSVVELRFLFTGQQAAKRNDAIIQERKVDQLVVPDHCCVHVLKRSFDTIFLPTFSFYPTKTNVPIEFLMRMLLTQEGWNKRFNRKEYVPQIQKLSGVDLSFVKT